jgi:lipocalin
MNTTTVKELDLPRYLGTWYEIARFDHRFERGLQGVTATYSMRDDGKIKVLNQGYENTLDGKLSVAEGKAKTTSEPGKLKVSFFWIFYADYFVLELDENYQWVLIGSSSDKYLWILSRTPQLEEKVKNHILEKAKERGYDISKLIWVKQKSM